MMERIDSAALNLGRKADARSATGSVHAKLAEVLARMPALGFAAVEYGTIVLSSVQTSNTATISSVDTTRATVMFLGASNDDGNPPRLNTEVPRLALTNATTVTATRNLANAVTLTVGFVVVSFTAPTQLQTGSIVIASGAATNTATITSVDTTRTILFWLGQETSETALGTSAFARIALTNATTITATRVGTGASTITVGYAVMTF